MNKHMNRIRQFLLAGAVAAGAIVGLAGQAGASTAPADKPVVTVTSTKYRSGGGVSPDSWYTTFDLGVGGFNFTAGGDVYVDVQDITAGGATQSAKWIKAGTGPCGFECNNYGRISTAVTFTGPYRSMCGHTLRVWAWDNVKSPKAGYGWSVRDITANC